MLICKECNEKNSENFTYCRKCGSKLTVPKTAIRISSQKKNLSLYGIICLLILSIIGNGLLYYQYSFQNNVVEDLKDELSVSNLHLTRLEKEKKSLQNEIDNLQIKIDDLESEVINLRNKINFWKNEADRFENLLEDCEDDFWNCQEYMEDHCECYNWY